MLISTFQSAAFVTIAATIPTLVIADTTLDTTLDAAPAAISYQPATATPEPTTPTPKDTPPPEKEALSATPATVTYAAEGSRWWMFTAGWGNDFQDSNDLNIAAAFSYFMVKDVEINAELGGWYHDQPGDDAVSLNASMVIRWHFIDRGKWTMYADMGIGVLGASSEVPVGGTSFDFTPRVGTGFTYQIGESNSRLIMGLRWAHFSNARIHGDENNPARDDVMLYGGVIFPF